MTIATYRHHAGSYRIWNTGLKFHRFGRGRMPDRLGIAWGVSDCFPGRGWRIWRCFW